MKILNIIVQKNGDFCFQIVFMLQEQNVYFSVYRVIFRIDYMLKLKNNFDEFIKIEMMLYDFFDYNIIENFSEILIY